MLLFPNCKINLGLHIIHKRTDGYHALETVFYPVGWKDALEAVPSSEMEFSSSGLPVAGEAGDNLCMRAYQLLKKDFPELPPIHIHLHKSIPMGAGLGGGSADGAFMLKLLNEQCGLSLSPEQLLDYALQLGSDCPFFIRNKPCFATGRGEQMEELALDLSTCQFILVHPHIHVSTAWAFAQLKPSMPPAPLKEIIQQPIQTWRHSLKNDFEVPVFHKYPEIGRIKEVLYTSGALYASMTGSGSTVFGIFERTQPWSGSFGNHYEVKSLIAI
ncbi:MAG: 4-(cytidine 5'-diphospho)-2-C-methyl-D-erythritol kinase [Sediminibacterium sp.]